MKRRSFRPLGIALILLGVACLGLGAYLFSRPPEYRATTRIKLLHNYPAESSSTSANTAELEANQTDVELLKSEIVLSPAAERLDLATAWGTGTKLDSPEVLRRLKQKVNVQSSPGTPFINISVLDRNPEEAARIADAIAGSYIAHRRAAALELARSSARSFTELREDVLQKIDAAEQEANTMATNLHIAILPPKDQLLFTSYRMMREQMAELTNALEGIEKKLAIAERFEKEPPAGAEVADRASIPGRPVDRSKVPPASLLSGGVILIIAGLLLGNRRFQS